MNYFRACIKIGDLNFSTLTKKNKVFGLFLHISPKGGLTEWQIGDKFQGS